MKPRDPYFDILKFIAMYMVVLWHIMDANSDVRSDLNYATNFILAVNMPLFFSISGYFARGLMSRLCWRELCDRLVGYFWPIVFWGILDASITVVQSESLTILSLPIVTVKSCLFKAWFFYALAICELLLFVSSKFCANRFSWGGGGGLFRIVFCSCCLSFGINGEVQI